MACTKPPSSTRLPSPYSPLARSPFLRIGWLPEGRSVDLTVPTRRQARARCHRARQSGRARVKRKHERWQSAGVEPLEEMIADAQRVGHGGKSRVHGARGGEEAGVDDVEVVDVVGFAVEVE